ncbi:MAG: class II aldolase/adducin family protein [Gammaproteobacteria bacterium]|nr:class II aldolase/adducin family protein [Gammaproteobacteria bacterium]
MPTEATLAIRESIVTAAQMLAEQGLSPGTSGNVSSRYKNGMLITPSGVNYAALTPDSLVFVDQNGQYQHDALKPSSEWQFHLSIYQHRRDINAVVHTHSEAATALACTGRSIPAFHYMVAIGGGENIRCAPYATFGTEALARQALEALEGRMACLLANHGAIACGESLQTAARLASEVEVLSAQYSRALSIGDVQILDTQEMQAIFAKFKGYGQTL